jgi:hypothetical protein
MGSAMKARLSVLILLLVSCALFVSGCGELDKVVIVENRTSQALEIYTDGTLSYRQLQPGEEKPVDSLRYESVKITAKNLQGEVVYSKESKYEQLEYLGRAHKSQRTYKLVITEDSEPAIDYNTADNITPTK